MIEDGGEREEEAEDEQRPGPVHRSGGRLAKPPQEVETCGRSRMLSKDSDGNARR